MSVSIREWVRRVFANLPLDKIYTMLVLLLLIPAIIYAVWYFTIGKTPFYEKKQYVSVVNFDTKKINKVRGNTIILGRGLPNAKVILVFTPGSNKASVLTDASGNWSYELPANLSGIHYLTLLVENNIGHLAKIKTYRTEIEQKKLSFQPPIPKAQAQLSSLGPYYLAWVMQMRTLGMYPAYEDGEVVFLSKNAFERKYCNPPAHTPGSPNSCLLPSFKNPTPFGQLVNMIRNQDIFIDELYTELYLQNYAPFEALAEYIPEILETEQYRVHRQRGGYIRSPYFPALKYTIDENTLRTLIVNVSTRRGNAQALYNNPLELVLATTDPIFGTRAWIHIVKSGAGHSVLEPISDAQLLNAVLGLTLAYGISEKVIAQGVQLTSKVSLNFSKIETKAIQEAVQSGQAVPLRAIKTAADDWLEFKAVSQTGEYLYFFRLPKSYPPEADEYFAKLVSFFDRYGPTNDYIYTLPVTRTRPLMERVYDYVKYLARKGYIDGFKVTKQEAMETVESRWVIGVDSGIWDEATGLAGPDGVTKGRLVIVKHQQPTDVVLIHEFGHVIGYRYLGREGISGKYFIFNTGSENSEYGRVMSILYELANDDMAAYLANGTSVYAKELPQLYQAVKDLIDYLTVYSNKRFTWEHFHAFGATADDATLLKTIFGREDPQAFLDLMQQKIDFSKIDKIYQSSVRKESLINAILVNPNLYDDIAILAAKGYTPAASSGSNDNPPVFIAPPVYRENINFLTPEFQSKDYFSGQVVIDQITGNTSPGGTLTVSAGVIERGLFADLQQFSMTWAIDTHNAQSFLPIAYAQKILPNSLTEVQPLPGGNNCDSTCDIQLPLDLSPQAYTLAVYLTKENSDEILASDSYPITITSSPENINDSVAIPPVLNQETIDTSFPDLGQTEAVPTLLPSPTEAPLPTGSENDASNLPSPTPACANNEDYSVFRGCNPNECGKEFWYCPAGGIQKPFDSPENGDCACRGNETPTFAPTLTLTPTTTDESQPTPTVAFEEASPTPAEEGVEPTAQQEEPTNTPIPTEASQEEPETLVAVFVNGQQVQTNDEIEVDLANLGATEGQAGFFVVEVLKRYSTGREERDYLGFQYAPCEQHFKGCVPGKCGYDIYVCDNGGRYEERYTPGGDCQQYTNNTACPIPTDMQEPTAAPSECEQHFKGCVPGKCGFDIYMCDDGSNYEERYTPGGDCSLYEHNDFCPQEEQPEPTEEPLQTGIVDCPADMWYNQCGGTAGLEDESFDRSRTYQIIPQCNQGTKDIVGYRNVHIGNLGQCCENVYYWDDVFKNPPMCIRKYSPESAFPNCSYAFGDVPGYSQPSCEALN